jgi:hypothetical protein
MGWKRVLLVLVSFVSGITLALLTPWLFHVAAGKILFPERRTEVSRVTSPDGRVDAVAERIDCGAPCSSGYSVSVVPRGATLPNDPAQRIFLADDIVNPQVKWDELHLLDIGYDKAFIQNFRNVTYPLGRPGNVESWGYAVEVHLSPSSSRFSYLPDGNQAKVSQ